MSITALHPAASEAPAADSDRPEAAPSRRARPLTEGEQQAVLAVAVLAAGLGLIGFANSFAAVATAARPSFGPLAPTVPLGIDLGIAIFAALDITLARLDLRPRWVPAVPWALTAATVWLNIAGQNTWFARVAHAVLPALWIAAVSLAAHVVRTRAGLAAGTAIDRIRPSRWLLAPLPTARLMRRMVLWEIRSYPDALTRERDRLLALTDLQDTYGPLAWRWRAPRRTRALYRLGELAPAVTTPALTSATGDDRSASPADTPAQARPRPTTRRKRARRTRNAPDVTDLMPLGWQAAAALAERGEPLTRDALAAALRAAGHPAGNARVGALLTRLKTETPPQTTAPAAAEGGTPS